MRQTFHFAVAKGIDAAHEEPPNTNFSPSFQERPPFFTFPDAFFLFFLNFSNELLKRRVLKRSASPETSQNDTIYPL